MKDPFLQLANAVNPFFRHYSSPRILGFSVAIAMIAGVIALTISNYKCSDVFTSTKKFEAVDGMFTLQKVFIDAFTERPVGLADDVKREENLCTLYAATRRYHTFNDAQGTGNSVTQALPDSCVLPPDEFLDHLNFPPAFYFCDLDTVPDKLKKLFHGRAGVPNMVEGKQYSPKEFFHILYDVWFPGWRCGPNDAFKSAVPAFAPHCNNIDPNKIYKYCGWAVDGDNPLNWPDYNNYPTGDESWYSHGYITSEKLTSKVCTSFTGSIGAAIGYVGYIEMVATMIFVYVLVGIGVAKPLNEKATIGNMLKGAGISAIAEELEQQNLQKENQKQKGSDSKVVPYDSVRTEMEERAL